MIIFNQDYLLPIFKEKLDITTSDGLRVIGRLNADSELVGMFGYDDWTGMSCEMHMWGSAPGWITKSFAYEAFKYPFLDCKCSKVLCRITSPVALDFALRSGFHLDFKLAGAHPDGPLHYLSLQPENCKWLKRH